jgi:hypothetical protein
MMLVRRTPPVRSPGGLLRPPNRILRRLEAYHSRPHPGQASGGLSMDHSPGGVTRMGVPRK